MVSIHRRETLNSQKRFVAIVKTLEKLAANGYIVLFISLLGTEQALDRFKLREKVIAMTSEYPDHFIYSEAWAYHRDIIAAMQKSAVVASDSGGFQEEANTLACLV